MATVGVKGLSGNTAPRGYWQCNTRTIEISWK